MCIQLLAIKIKIGYTNKRKKWSNMFSVKKNAINANKYETIEEKMHVYECNDALYAAQT